MKTEITIVVCALSLFFSCEHLLASTTYPMGVYMDVESIQTKVPDERDFQVVTRGENASLVSEDEDKMEAFIGIMEANKEWYAVSDGNHLYLNCGQFGFDEGYSKVIVEGHFLVFEASMTEQGTMPSPSFELGSRMEYVAIPRGTNPCIYDIDRGRAWVLTNQTMTNVLSINESLAQKFASETVSTEGFVAYIQDLNQTIESGEVDFEKLYGDEKVKYPFHFIVYREKKNESDEEIEIVLNDKVNSTIGRNDYQVFKLSSIDGNVLCLGEGTTACKDVMGKEGDVIYAKVSAAESVKKKQLKIVSEHQALEEGKKIKKDLKRDDAWFGGAE